MSTHAFHRCDLCKAERDIPQGESYRGQVLSVHHSEDHQQVKGVRHELCVGCYESLCHWMDVRGKRVLDHADAVSGDFSKHVQAWGGQEAHDSGCRCAENRKYGPTVSAFSNEPVVTEPPPRNTMAGRRFA